MFGVLQGADKTAAQMTPTRGGKRKETDGQTTDKNKKGRLVSAYCGTGDCTHKQQHTPLDPPHTTH